MNDLKDLFGRPGEGLHGYRVANVAVVDVAVTLVVAWVLANRRWVPWWPQTFAPSLLLLLLIGVLAHRAFDVRTTVDKMLFGGGGGA